MVRERLLFALFLLDLELVDVSLSASTVLHHTMSLGEELKEKEAAFDDASTAAPTPMERSTANSIHSSKDSLDKEDRPPSEEVGTPLEPVESSMYPNMTKLIPILVAIVMSVFLVALDMTIIATAIPAITGTPNESYTAARHYDTPEWHL